jgi:quercetin dioxygenase-like cupin family protein
MIRKALLTPLGVAAYAAVVLSGAAPSAYGADGHAMLTPDKLTWGPAPPQLPKGAEIAVIMGDPGKAEPFVMRARMPAGYEVRPHSHPTDEHVTVLSGSMNVSMGPAADKAKGAALGPGGFFTAPKGMTHYAWFTEPTIIQVHGVGPFAITYVDPKDDPSKSN